MKKYFLIFAVLLNACIMVPQKYLDPIKKKQINSKKTIRIENFVETLQTTGYTPNSLSEEFRGILANTGCFTVVTSDSKSDLVLVGKVGSQPDMSWHYFMQFVEGVTLTPILGMPFPVRGSGIGSINVYNSKNNEILESVTINKFYLSGWMTIYSHEKEREGLSMIRTMAMRDLAEELSDRFCKE